MTIGSQTDRRPRRTAGVRKVEVEIAGGFEAAAPAVMGRLARAMRSLVGAVPGPVTTAAELERGLGVSKKVAWQVHKIAESREALAAAGFVPGADPVRKLLAAAARRRVPAGVRAELAEAFEAFEAFVRRHAGDRASFLSMLGGAGDGADADVDRLHRRACFRAYSHFVGAQIQTRYSVTMVRKDPSDDALDTFVSLRGRMGLRRLRHDSTVVVDRYFVTTAAFPAAGGVPIPEPLDAKAQAAHGAPILPAFCTKPLPDLTTVSEAEGVARVELRERAVGLAGAVDLVFGTVTRSVRGAGSGRSDGKPHGFHTMTRTDLPTAVLITDVLVHAGDYGRLAPELYVYADPRAEDSAEHRERSPLLRCGERVEYLGRGLSAGACPEVPRYGEMLGHLSGRLGWDADEFDLYRVRVEYPLVHSVVRLAFPST